MKILSSSNAKYSPWIPLMLLIVEKIKSENCNSACSFLSFFFLSFFLLSFFFSLTHNPKTLWHVSVNCTPTTALLSEIFLFSVRAACEVRSASYVYKHTSQSLSYTPFVHYYTYNMKLKAAWEHSTSQTIALLLSEKYIFWVRAIWEIQLASYGSKHASQPLSNTTFCESLHS